jgi:hypothetical protein
MAAPLRSQELKRVGSVSAPAGFAGRVLKAVDDDEARPLTNLRIRSSKMQFTGIDIDDLVLVRDTLRAAAIDRASKQPHDNRLVRHLYRLARIFDELAG